METSVYEIEAEVEATHWWFAGRRKLFAHILKELKLPKDTPILDVGSGTGANLRLLREQKYSDVTGTDLNEAAIRFCAEKNLGRIEMADVCDLPFRDGRFHLVFATDVIEHVDEEKALAEIFRALSPGGFALFTVPAFQSLWGIQDDVSHHRLRYRKPQMEKAVKKAGFEIQKSFYFNYILFIPIWLARQIIRIFDVKLESENQVNSPLINSVLTKLFHLDIVTSPLLKPPFGVSILILGRKRV